MILQGVSPCGRAYFLLLRQKKVAKEKATPRSAPGVARSLALLGRPGGLPELACGSDMANRNPPARLRCSAPSTGVRSVTRLGTELKISFHGQPPKQTQNKTIVTSSTPALLLPLKRGRPGGGCFSGPLRGAEQRRSAGGFRLALFEPQASLARRPAFRVAQGTGAAGTDPGVAFSLLTFFWRSKRK